MDVAGHDNHFLDNLLLVIKFGEKISCNFVLIFFNSRWSFSLRPFCRAFCQLAYFTSTFPAQNTRTFFCSILYLRVKDARAAGEHSYAATRPKP